MAKKLYYFNINGLAEPIRYILHYAGENFEDIRYERSEWPIESVKKALPYGQLPLYEEGDHKLNQSLAIARYVGAKNNLVPTDLWEQALLDAAVLNIYDFWKHVGAYFKETDPVRKEEAKKNVLETQIDFYFSRFEKEIKANNGHFGSKLSWADFILVGVIEVGYLILGIEIDKNYPAVHKLVEEIRNLPGVKEYIAQRKPYVL